MRLPEYVTTAIEAAAIKGAARLDSRKPRWYRKVNRTELQMQDGCSCIIGQVYGDYDEDNLRKVIGSWFTLFSDRNVESRYGFVLPEEACEWADQTSDWDKDIARNNACWSRLERAWKSEIEARYALERS